jgi:putative sterol carrier protein
MGGFTDWVENVADSKNAHEYREKVSDPETVSLWQSLGFGPNYKAAYCLSVCPAGEDVIAPFLNDRKQYLHEVVKPLQNKAETIYVRPGSDAEQYVQRRFLNKTTKRVGNGLRPRSIDFFLKGLAYAFERGKSEGLNATYHFTFTGKEEKQATVTIRDGALHVQDNHQGEADLRVTADSETWLGFLAKERNLLWALLRRRIRIKGSPRLLLAFGKCFGA